MLVTFTSLFDIYPDKLRKGAVVGYRKPDGTPLEFPCTLETGDAVKDAKGRWTASGLGLKPVVVRYTQTLERTKAVEAWIGDGFEINPKSYAWNLSDNFMLERVRFVDRVTTIGDYAFYGCSSLTSVTIPEGVTEIGDWAFYNCTALTSVTIPSSVTSIGDYAFSRCTGLTSVKIPSSVTSIGDWAFYNCTGLTSVEISENITEIGNGAFYDCCYLTSITIPSSVTSIGNYAFYECTTLTDVYVDQPESDLLDKADVSERCTVHWKQVEAI